MDCNIVKDLIPLYIDECCSEESANLVKEHIDSCAECRKLYENMTSPSEIKPTASAPLSLNRINDWKASILQSVLLFVSFAVITLGVSLEAATPSGLNNGCWAFSLVIPASGFMLSLINWYFVRFYKNRKSFSNCSLSATLGITVCAYVWAVFHYELSVFASFAGISLLLTALFCILSKVLSDKYGKMLGKE